MYNTCMDIRYTKQAIKYLRKCQPNQAKRITAKIELIAAGQVEGLNIVPLKGVEDAYRLRVGDYQAIYEIIDDELVLVVVKVGSRGDIYK